MRGVVLALALALAPALVAADHVYSHRFVFEGRLMGSDGTPLPGREVEFFTEGATFRHPCLASASTPTTDEWGDFRFCWHEHELRTSIRSGIRVGNVTVVKPIDTAFRRTVVIAHEPNETGVAPPAWDSTYRVSGKAWQPMVTTLEHVQVYGIAVDDLTVNLTVKTPTGERTLQDVTDGFGDFDFVFSLSEGERAEDVAATLEALGREHPVKLDPVSHRTTAPLYVQGGRVGDIEATFPQNAAPRMQAPGGTPPVGSGLVMTMALALIGVTWMAQRRA